MSGPTLASFALLQAVAVEQGFMGDDDCLQPTEFEKEIDTMVEDAFSGSDVNDDGKLSFDEFKRWLLNTPEVCFCTLPHSHKILSSCCLADRVSPNRLPPSSPPPHHHQIDSLQSQPACPKRSNGRQLVLPRLWALSTVSLTCEAMAWTILKSSLTTHANKWTWTTQHWWQKLAEAESAKARRRWRQSCSSKTASC